mgnify:CR=1 FL=1
MKIMKSINKKVKKGFSLLELAMVLVVGAIMLAGVMMYYNNVTVNQKTQDAISELAVIQEAVRSLGAGHNGYDWVTSSLVAQSGEIPNKWITGSNVTGGNFSGASGISNPFSGTVDITSSNGGQTFKVEYNNVPTQACSKMVVMDLGSGVYDMSIGGDTVNGTALTPNQASTACSKSQRVNLYWDFY